MVMKKSYLIILLLIFTTTLCKKDECDLDFGLDCKKLKTGILNANLETSENDSLISVEIDKLTKDLTPKPSKADRNGQLNNLYILFNRLNTFDNLTFDICCYSCIQTGIPQTEVLVIADSNGVQIKRIFDFATGYQMNLTFGQAHSYYGSCKK
jgi:hypothetical protein